MKRRGFLAALAAALPVGLLSRLGRKPKGIPFERGEVMDVSAVKGGQLLGSPMWAPPGPLPADTERELKSFVLVKKEDGKAGFSDVPGGAMFLFPKGDRVPIGWRVVADNQPSLAERSMERTPWRLRRTV